LLSTVVDLLIVTTMANWGLAMRLSPGS